MSGYSRTDKRSSATKPKMISSRLMTVANTGRRIETSEILIGGASSLGDGRAGGVDLQHRDAVPNLLRPFDDDTLAAIETGRHLHLTRAAAADRHFALAGEAVLDDEHEGLALLGHERALGDQQHLRGRGADLRG